MTKQTLIDQLAPITISAPFGNYIQPDGTTPTLGTFTRERRGGRTAAFGRAMLTMRYYRRLGAWVNKIGLRNPGIDSVVQQPKYGRPLADCLLSVHGFSTHEWDVLLQRVAQLRPLAVELNISCPNVGGVSWPDHMFEHAVATGVPVIVKIPPIRYEAMVAAAVDAGVSWVHATNTLPVPSGGMSGLPLKPLAIDAVVRLRAEYGQQLGIIGGGGIRHPDDLLEFHAAGADRFAIGTHSMRPAALRSDRWIAELRATAQRLVRDDVAAGDHQV